MGKTSFKTRLIGSSDNKQNENAHKQVQKKEEFEMTHGVEIYKWRNPINDTYLTIWDFAGK